MDRIGRYRIAGEVGRGAMGVVYRAVDPAIGRDVAIKTIRLDADDGHSTLRERLFREARSAGVLSHPNILTIYDMGETEVEGVGLMAYVAMGLVKGPSLEALMQSPEPIESARMMSILRQTAVALDYAHSRGLVHRDIKPGNIMTDEDGSVKITDFGIARFVASEHLNETDTITGTPNYMSPEQVQGLDVDGRADQFALAVIAWEILTGERPFPGDNLSTVVYKIVTEDPGPAHALNASLTPEIDGVLRRALAKNPGARFATCGSFVGSLETACASAPGWKPAPNGAFYSMPTVGVNWEKPAPQPPLKLPPSQPAMPAQFRPLGAGPVPRAAGPLPPFSPASAARAAASREEMPRPGVTGYKWLLAASLTALVVFGAFVFWPDAAITPPLISEASAPAQTTEVRREPAASRAVPSAPAPNIPVPGALKPPVVREEKAVEPVVTRKGAEQDIWLETVPPDVQAVLDGKQSISCVTPCVLHAKPGLHQITFSLNGYRHEVREFRVQDQTLDLPPVKMQEVMGSLLVATSPPGATIMLNGEALPQTTPAALSLKPGSYRITVAKNGVTKTERVQLGDRSQLLRIPLEP